VFTPFVGKNADSGPARSTPRPRDAREPGLKIVDITEFYSERGGGIRSHLTNRGQFLADNRHSHVIIAPGPRDEDEPLLADDDARFAHSRLVRFAGPSLPYDRTYHLLHRIDKIRRRVREEQPDVLEAHSLYLANAAVLASGRRGGRLHTAFWHSDHVGVHVESALTKRLGCAVTRAVVQPLWRGIRALLAPFDAIFAAGRQQTNLLRAAGVRRVIHAPLGVDTRTFSPAARRDEWRSKWLGAADDPGSLIVACGRLAAEKRFDVVLEAFGQVRSRRKAVLVVFGDGPERKRLEQRSPPGVHFVGFDSNRARLATALASADVLVHAAPYETFGLGIAEAVACGLPIVVPDAGAAAEHAESSCSEMYRSLDPVACGAAIERMLDRAPDSRAQALGAVSRVVSVEQHFARVLGAYRDLIVELGR
jgi:alpha-1,6-mannosyltransferase